MALPRPSFARFLALPFGVRVAALIALATIFIVLGWRGYETYDYIQHDNDFCQNCHLMEDPFRRFQESGHRELSCKACHHPTLIERSKMALTQFVEQPTEISHHAHVPNEVCATCHIDGDPERWKLIAETAGHKVHLESDRLEGLQCVQCHTAAIHEFLPLDRTCGQSECHPTTRVNLGKMANESELHCVSCHDFLAAPGQRIGPRQEDCLQCHAMQERLAGIQFDDDPHKGNCRDCHNAHEHEQPAQAVESCLKAGCHGDYISDPATLPAMHRGLDEESLRNCLQCHQAHDWKIGDLACSSCHDRHANDLAVAGQRFDHSRHERLECSNCHDHENSHGGLLVNTALQCMSCHHDPARPQTGCQSCHSASEMSSPIRVERELTLSVGARQRSIGFEHARHAALECGSCHASSALLSSTPRQLAQDCAACHSDHHEIGNDCSSCHGTAVKASHDRSSHEGCSGAACHAEGSVARVVQAQDRCLLCHGDRADHEPGSNCRSCHFPGQSAP